jgi:8-oxo-dGTP pyrophosphatase MutT (NUDIX family)
MVNEPAGIAGGKPRYWLPAGRVDAGEGMIEAGKREALEEAGIEVEIINKPPYIINEQCFQKALKKELITFQL